MFGLVNASAMMRSRSRRWMTAVGGPALCVGLMAGLLIGVGSQGAQAGVLAGVGAVEIPAKPDILHVGATGTVYATLPSEDAIAIVSTAEQPQVRLIELPGSADPFDITVTADEATAFVSRLPDDANPEGRLDRVDLNTGEVTQIEGMGYWPTGLALSQDDQTLVVAVLAEREAVLIDTASNSVRERVEVRSGASVVAIRGNIAYVGSTPTIDAIDLRTGTVIASTPSFDGEVVSLTLVGDQLIGVSSVLTPQAPRLLAWDARTLDLRQSIEIPTSRPELSGRLSLTSSASHVYAMSGLDWAVAGSVWPVVTIPVTSTGFGEVEPLDYTTAIPADLATNANGSLLVLAGTSEGTPTIEWFETGDGQRSVAVGARLKGRTLIVSGETKGIARGTRVRVFVRKSGGFKAQKKQARVQEDGTFTWRIRYRGKSARIYVQVDGLTSERVTVRR